MEEQNTKGASAAKGEQKGEVSAVNAPDSKVVMGILAYIGPLVIVSYLVAKNEPFVKFHIKQGLVLFVLSVILWFLLSSPLAFVLYMFSWVIFPVLFVFSVIGIVNVVKGEEKPLPLIGRFSEYFPI
jgi:uncharacterized membrane protein